MDHPHLVCRMELSLSYLVPPLLLRKGLYGRGVKGPSGPRVGPVSVSLLGPLSGRLTGPRPVARSRFVRTPPDPPPRKSPAPARPRPRLAPHPRTRDGDADNDASVLPFATDPGAPRDSTRDRPAAHRPSVRRSRPSSRPAHGPHPPAHPVCPSATDGRPCRTLGQDQRARGARHRPSVTYPAGPGPVVASPPLPQFQFRPPAAGTRTALGRRQWA